MTDTRRTFTDPEVQAANDSGCVFYEDPATLRDEQIDPLLRAAVRTINQSGWVWTAESCQGHPDAADATVWAGNTRPMLRLVTRMENRPQLMAALTAAFADSNEWNDLPTVTSMAIYPYNRRNGWFEALVYVPATTVYERDLGCKCFDRFAEIVVRTTNEDVTAASPTETGGASDTKHHMRFVGGTIYCPVEKRRYQLGYEHPYRAAFVCPGCGEEIAALNV